MKQMKYICFVVSLSQNCLQLMCHLTVFEIPQKDRVTLVPLKWNWMEPSVLSCARNCLLTYRSCYSFIYNKQTRRCISGSWIIPSNTSRDDKNEVLYSKGAICAENFTVITENGFAACLQVFINKLSYNASRSHCKDMGAELYTMRSLEKFNILHSELNHIYESFWIGLNDLRTEGDFVWDDDGESIDENIKIKMFAPGEHKYIAEKGCVVYTPSRTGLDDQNCSFLNYYICEVKPSGLA